MEKEEIYIPPPCLKISYVLTMIAYENRSYISHMPGMLKPHTCIFFFSPSSQEPSVVLILQEEAET